MRKIHWNMGSISLMTFDEFEAIYTDKIKGDLNELFQSLGGGSARKKKAKTDSAK